MVVFSRRRKDEVSFGLSQAFRISVALLIVGLASAKSPRLEASFSTLPSLTEYPQLNPTMHPAALDELELLSQCALRRERRKGPGGQHRNKVETAVVIQHLPTGIAAEANERRSQAENKRVALQRLRLALALEVRSNSESQTAPSQLWKSRVRDRKIAASDQHADFPALIAEALDQLNAQGFDLAGTARALGVTSSQLIRLFKKHPPAFQRINQERMEKGLHALK